MEDHWWRILDYLELIGNNGIILNPQKFQLCQHEVQFTGFLLTEDSIKPLPKYLDAIRNIPRPSTISDIWLWFRLVNQISHYTRVMSLMASFKPLLLPKTRFCWDNTLGNAFQQSKLEIIKAMEERVCYALTGLRGHCLFPLPKVL
jgi:hypothetical protein